jgi:hypothetical protein
VPRSVTPNDKDIINDLLARQNDVIEQLSKLEADVLTAVESLNLANREESAPDTENADTIVLPLSTGVTTAAGPAAKAA